MKGLISLICCVAFQCIVFANCCTYITYYYMDESCSGEPMFSLESKDIELGSCVKNLDNYIINTKCTIDQLNYEFYGKDKNCAKSVQNHSFKKDECVAITEDEGLENYVKIQVHSEGTSSDEKGYRKHVGLSGSLLMLILLIISI